MSPVPNKWHWFIYTRNYLTMNDDFDYTEEELLGLYTGELPKENGKIVLELIFNH